MINRPLLSLGIATMLIGLAPQPASSQSALHYFGRTDYVGPGLICGSTFTFLLAKGETAVLTKSIPIVATYTFSVGATYFSIFESQYTNTGGVEYEKTKLGAIYLKVDSGHSRWIYRDSAPGSTDVYGPAVDGSQPTSTFKRISFGPPASRDACLTGVGSDDRSGTLLP
jgi:hypothetical protein